MRSCSQWCRHQLSPLTSVLWSPGVLLEILVLFRSSSTQSIQLFLGLTYDLWRLCFHSTICFTVYSSIIRTCSVHFGRIFWILLLSCIIFVLFCHILQRYLFVIIIVMVACLPFVCLRRLTEFNFLKGHRQRISTVAYKTIFRKINTEETFLPFTVITNKDYF